ncbi:ProQ/FINO family protein [Bradyrhizobium sp. SZCCHNS3051]|uniref:ProQ/FINO family protein n=1 Tax=Bradyrhizobium sp. SZCCHNS3051 TaxID=3057320 RepID=UPI0029169CC4|nr:ProQ/FINO family protein [Bradyrhizobium sp. SZCCHNS3051]
MAIGDPSRSATIAYFNSLAGPAAANGTIEPQSVFPERSSTADNAEGSVDPAIDALRLLRSAFPASIARASLPLRRGICADIAERLPELDPAIVDRALAIHVGHSAYLRSIAAGTARVDLDGNEVDVVTVAEAANAHQRLDRLAWRRAARKAAASKVAAPPEAKRLSITGLRAAARNRAARASAPP